MITLFSTPKNFIEESNIIQKNAFSSWRSISDEIEIIIMGNSEGTKEAALDIDAKFIPDIPLSTKGTPTIPGLFHAAERKGSNNIFCFLNSDIILSPNFFSTIQNIHSKLSKFLAVGYRYNIDVRSSIDFSNKSESNRFFTSAKKDAVKGISSAIDIFCFTRGVYKNIPEFSVGRPGFDNWLLWKARRTFVPVIDITTDTKIYHQNHSYNFKSFKTHSDILNSDEAKLNYNLLGNNGLTLNDTNWVLKDGKLGKKNNNEFKQRNLGKLGIIFPEFSFILKLYKKIYRRLINFFNS